ncbi:MAG: hypothetical protein H8Z69_02300 [Nanohaloarchaea archaeon]|nr:hypothetical protein [Candidatus Nanohaloarchaea archaeon]
MKNEDILEQYEEKKQEIDSRLNEFESLRKAEDRRVFKELVFVILTSQTSAEKAWKSTEKLDDLQLLERGDKSEIAEVLSRYEVQYEKNKASYVVENREMLSQPTLQDPTKSLKLRNKIDEDDLDKTRKWFAENIKGMSWKGASHFLRNIGYGDDFAIISAYISKSLYSLGRKEDAEPPKDREEYMEDEELMHDIAEETGIDIQALDLVLWSMENGEVFK